MLKLGDPFRRKPRNANAPDTDCTGKEKRPAKPIASVWIKLIVVVGAISCTLILMGLVLAVVWITPQLPKPLFDRPWSALLMDQQGLLLSARVAQDGQWRFPQQQEVPERFKQALLQAEDKRFYKHPGVDPVAVLRALKSNLQAGKIVSGASTLSMQTVRLALGNPPRTYQEKAREALMALALEWQYSKEEILEKYAAQAPFGGNVVGIQAAAWRYFGRPPEALTWAEAATLAVLPNAPGLIHPGQRRGRLLQKRNALLNELFKQSQLNELELELALAEPLPERPLPLPNLAGHLLDRLRLESGDKVFHSTLDLNIQKRLRDIVSRHHRQLSKQHIYNAAILLIDNQQRQVAGYIGNTGATSKSGRGYAMDLVQRPRSTGSILKPFLYASMLQEGYLVPKMLWPDIPTHFDGFRPKNYDQQYRGIVTATDALTDSLNVPFVSMLQTYGVAPFYDRLKKMGMSTLFREPDGYGLTLILGGAEGTLWDITDMYGRLAESALHKPPFAAEHRPLSVLLSDSETELAAQTPKGNIQNAIGAGGAWLTLEALLDTTRPGDSAAWTSYLNSQKIAWKTGTSQGFRDAWAVGVTPRWTLGVWVGNASGEGRPELTGAQAAAPILMDLFNALPAGGWFEKPDLDLKAIHTCKDSGYLPKAGCETEEVLIPKSSFFAELSPYHRQIQVTQDGKARVNSDCESVANMKYQTLFELRPIEAYFYQRYQGVTQMVPSWRYDCQPEKEATTFQLVYPNVNTSIYIPIDFGGRVQALVMKAVHKRTDATLHWHINGEWVGTTRHFHELSVQLTPGRQHLVLVDDQGERVSQRFRVEGQQGERSLNRYVMDKH